MVRRGPLFLLTVSFVVGCNPQPSLPDVQERTRRVAKVETPATVKAGPYRLNFVPERSEAVYMVWTEGSPYASLSLQSGFTLVRPQGPGVPLRIKIQDPGFDVARGKGDSFSYPSGPKPNWLDTIDLSETVAPGWRGERIEVKGELQEMAERSYVAVFRTPKFEAGGESAILGSPPHALVATLARPETIVLEDGVTATVAPVRDHPESLQVEVAWDEKRVMPDVPADGATLPKIVSNVGSIGTIAPGRVGIPKMSFLLALDDGRNAGNVPQELRLDVKFEKRRRGYPFKLPLRLVWPKEKPAE